MRILKSVLRDWWSVLSGRGRGLSDQPSERGSARQSENTVPSSAPPQIGAGRAGFSQRETVGPPFPLVSVIVPTYNRREGLRVALGSIAAQTYTNIEVVLINDAGEAVADIVKEHDSKLNIKYANHERNLGTGAARNTAMGLASGTYIAFLDDDDSYHPGHITTLARTLTRNPDAVGAYSDAEEISGDSRKVRYSYDYSFPHLLALNYIPNLCLMVRRDIAVRAGGFDECMPLLEDWEWLIRIARLGQLTHVPEITAAYRVGGASRNFTTTARIADVYRTIYNRYSSHATPETIEIQQHVFKQVTGTELTSEQPNVRATP